MKTSILFYFIPILLTINFVFQIFFHPTYGISPDSFDYINISEQIPLINNSLFPFFYPFTIKIFNQIFENYFFTTKFISLFSLYFCLLFTYFKNFFWKQFWILLCLPSFLDIYHNSWAETILLPLLILFVYVSYNFLIDNFAAKKFILLNSLILSLMLFTKYSMVAILIGYGAFSIYIYFKKRNLFSHIIFSLGISSFIFVLYLLLNKYQTGYFMGLRIASQYSYMSLKLSLFNIIHNLNPFFNKRYFLGNRLNDKHLFIFTLLLFIPIFNTVAKKIKASLPVILFLICSIVFILFTLFSYVTVKLDLLDSRLLMPFTFLFLGSLVFLLKDQFLKIGKFSTVLMVYFSVGISISNAYFNFKNNVNYHLLIKKQLNELQNINKTYK